MLRKRLIPAGSFAKTAIIATIFRLFAGQNRRALGVIQRQSIKDSIVIYLGVALGAINTLFIYPLLPKEILGLFQYLLSAALIITPFLQLGMQNVAVRFFPEFRDESKRHQGFLLILLIPSIIWFALFSVLILLLKGPIQGLLKSQEVNPLAIQFILYILPLAFFITINSILIQYIKNFLRIVIPTLLDNVWIKIVTGATALFFAFQFTDVSGYVLGNILGYAVVTLGLLIYARWLGQLHLQPDFSKLKNYVLLRDIRVFAFYAIIGSIGASLMTYIDRFMITVLLGEKGLGETGIFTIVAYIGTTIDTPRKSLEKITQPIVTEALLKEDWAEVGRLYQRSSINLLVFGLLIFLGVWLNLDSLFDLMPSGDQYRPYKVIVLFLGIASLVDMVTSINNQIIGFSKYFRFSFYVVLTLAGLNVVFNYLFIKTFGFGIFGAALATFVSIIIYNLIKLGFIWQKFNRMQPFSWATLWIILVGTGVYSLVIFIPNVGHPMLTIVYKSILISILYAVPIWYFQLAPDLNALVINLLQKAKQRFNF